MLGWRVWGRENALHGLVTAFLSVKNGRPVLLRRQEVSWRHPFAWRPVPQMLKYLVFSSLHG
jgi:hypothetical protein